MATPKLTDHDATLSSLRLVAGYPLYTMRYVGSYEERFSGIELRPGKAAVDAAAQASCGPQWGCSLFTALGDENDRLLGRDFGWEFSPALLLFTDPPEGYASVSMVDIAYLGFEGEGSKKLEELSLKEREPLLNAPVLPFDGMNEKGIAVGMAAVPEQSMPRDPQHRTVGSLEAIREVLDHAATVDEAVEILAGFNIDMGSVPIHYLIGSAAGESALVEFYEGKMVVFRNDNDWQTATNFLVASAQGHAQGHCPRYDRMQERLARLHGRIAAPDALALLEDVSQDSTQWSIVYHMTSGEIEVVMGRGYSEPVNTFKLETGTR
jgi:hypothetical protein